MRFYRSREFRVNSGAGTRAVLTVTNVALYIWQSGNQFKENKYCGSP